MLNVGTIHSWEQTPHQRGLTERSVDCLSLYRRRYRDDQRWAVITALSAAVPTASTADTGRRSQRWPQQNGEATIRKVSYSESFLTDFPHRLRCPWSAERVARSRRTRSERQQLCRVFTPLVNNLLSGLRTSAEARLDTKSPTAALQWLVAETWGCWLQMEARR